MGKKVNQLPIAEKLLSTDLTTIADPITGAMRKLSLKQLRDFIKLLFDPSTVDITKISDVHAFGDGCIAGVDAQPISEGFIQRFCREYNKKMFNYGAGAAGIHKVIGTAFEKLPQVNSNVLTIAMAGIVDVALSGNNSKTFEKIKQAYRSLIANQFLKTAVPFSDGNITKTGVWKVTNYPSSTVGGKAEHLGGKGIASTDKSDKAEWNFTGNNVVIGYIGSDGDPMRKQGDFTVYIDGVNHGSYNQNDLWDGIASIGYDNQIGPACIVFTGLSSGMHTLSIETNSTDLTVFDYVGTMHAPEDCAPIIISEIIKLNPDFVRIYPALVIKDTYMEFMYKNDLYKPLTLDEAVEICKILYCEFGKKGIQIIRLGLQTTEQINLGKDVVSGPFHPAFRELVESSLLNDIVVYMINKYFLESKEVNISISPRDISKLYADKKKYFYNKTKQYSTIKLKILQDEDMIPMTLSLDDGEKVKSMSINDFIKITY